jgi:Cu/Ag efflux protein CusF
LKLRTLLTGLGTLAIAACGQPQGATPEANLDAGAQAAEGGQTYSGTGKVTAVAGDQVTISHGPIEGLGWPAMTMGFTAPEGIAGGVQAGSNVSFSFRQQGGAYALTSLETQ